jgi:hypothetical protein
MGKRLVFAGASFLRYYDNGRFAMNPGDSRTIVVGTPGENEVSAEEAAKLVADHEPAFVIEDGPGNTAEELPSGPPQDRERRGAPRKRGADAEVEP